MYEVLDQERTKEIESMWIDDLERFENALSSQHSSPIVNRKSIDASEGDGGGEQVAAANIDNEEEEVEKQNQEEDEIEDEQLTQEAQD